MRGGAAIVVLGCALLAACRQDMHDQPKLKPQRPSRFFPDGRASQAPPDGTVARGQLDVTSPWATGKDTGGAPVGQMPVALTRPLLARGRERYDVFCSPCHDRAGTGNGMIVQRGYRRPPSLHDERLRAAPDGHFFDVMTNGFGVMPRYAAQVPVADRWAIVAYVRALQTSRSGTVADVPAAERARLEVGK